MAIPNVVIMEIKKIKKQYKEILPKNETKWGLLNVDTGLPPDFYTWTRYEAAAAEGTKTETAKETVIKRGHLR